MVSCPKSSQKVPKAFFPPEQKTGKVANQIPGKNYDSEEDGHIVFHLVSNTSTEA